jgi:N-acetyl-gamma-glutamyl-phosphate reductase
VPPSVLRARRVTARSDAGRGSTSCTRATASPLELEELDLERHGDVEAAIVAYPHGARRPSSPRCAAAA